MPLDPTSRSALALNGLKNCSRLMLAVIRDESGLSLVEFALILPIFVSISAFGIEIAYLATVDLQMSQIAASLADNGSRLGQTENSSVTPSISAGDVSSVLQGTIKQGETFEILTKGRIILSSLEEDLTNGDQVIRWQKCAGLLAEASAYGPEGTNLSDSQGFGGVGPSGNIVANEGSAVMIAEVHYKHEGIFGDLFIAETTLHKEGIFLIRDDRDLVPGITGNTSEIDC